MTRPTILGTGSYLPKRILTNRDLEKMVDTSDEWITTRTGIKSRRIATKGEETSRIAAAAGKDALKMAGLTPDEIDLIIVGTMTPEMAMPSCACFVQQELGAVNAFALDVNAACSGFVYGLDTADKYLRCKPDMKALIIGTENLSARVNWKDRDTCVLFGDGAGACVLATSDNNDSGILASRLFSDGRLSELLMLDSAP
ncbi:MAG: beta-ketoacyl-ACP synthase 3, partial [Desulfobulbaceae bacterium]|nr:beta-ketoacyl-ACP synthase 3 [Desulfobulbaceae bacterium]